MFFPHITYFSPGHVSGHLLQSWATFRGFRCNCLALPNGEKNKNWLTLLLKYPNSEAELNRRWIILVSFFCWFPWSTLWTSFTLLVHQWFIWCRLQLSRVQIKEQAFYFWSVIQSCPVDCSKWEAEGDVSHATSKREFVLWATKKLYLTWLVKELCEDCNTYRSGPKI